MTRPRTSDQFPRMKVRGGRRRSSVSTRQGLQEVSRAAANAGRAFIRVRLVAGEFVHAVQTAAAVVRTSWWLGRRRARDQWLSRRMLPATPSPWAAPIRKDVR